ncbi:MAG TPA: SBBP repeat-containing protein [Dehalococcoidales bacterium]
MNRMFRIIIGVSATIILLMGTIVTLPAQTVNAAPDSGTLEKYTSSANNGSPSPTEEWVARYNGTGNDMDIAVALDVDTSGNVYVTGYSHGSGTAYDFATIKYDNNGVEQWVARYNGPGNSADMASDLAIDTSGNVYVTGYSHGSGTAYDFATIKYDNNGVERWVARYNGTGNIDDCPYDLAIDVSGNVYVTGYSRGSGTSYDFATIKYNNNGVQQWLARYNGPGNSGDTAEALAVDTSGNVYVTGESVGIGTYEDFATIKYNNNGVQQWVARYNGTGNRVDIPTDLAIDTSGNVYIAGGSVGIGTYEDFATIKYNNNGVQQWVARYNGPVNSSDGVEALAIDTSGNVYVTGESIISGTSYDFATIKYDNNGVQQWVARYNGTGNGSDWPTDLAIDTSGNVYVTGESIGTDHDFATIKYNNNGVQQWVARYDSSEYSYDGARALVVDATGDIYVTGYSYGSGTSYDFATIKYSQGSWSFAVITDIHIGYCTPDYAGHGFGSENTDPENSDPDNSDVTIVGQDYFLTARLTEAINWINAHYNDPDKNIKFVVVDGDISDTAERSEYKKARDILNELSVPYFPLIGNHDIWPYIVGPNQTPDDRRNPLFKSPGSETNLGDKYFEEIFWGSDPENKNLDKIQGLLGENGLVRQEGENGYEGAPYYQNYAFSYGGINFIALDFEPRHWRKSSSGFNFGMPDESKTWFEQKLTQYEKQRVIMLHHRPISVQNYYDWDCKYSIQDVIEAHDCQVLSLSGHTHRNLEQAEGDHVDNNAQTQAVLQTPPWTTAVQLAGDFATGEFIRLITVSGPSFEDINYDTVIDVVAEVGLPPAINPYFYTKRGEYGVNEVITFTAEAKNLSRAEIFRYIWKFDDPHVRYILFEPTINWTYQTKGPHPVSLTIDTDYVDNNNNEETVSWTLHVVENAATARNVSMNVPELTAVMGGDVDRDLTEPDNAQNTVEWVTMLKTASPPVPTGSFRTHFEQASQNIDLSGIVADVDLDTKKSILYMSAWPSVVEESKLLYIPYSENGTIYVCPQATSLEDVYPEAPGTIFLEPGVTLNGMTAFPTIYDGKPYYIIDGFTNGGGGLSQTPGTNPSVTTNAAAEVTSTEATLNGELTDMGLGTSVDVYFEWGTTTNYGEYALGTPSPLTAPGTFSAYLAGLTPGTTYHYRAVACIPWNFPIFGEDQQFTFITNLPPVANANGPYVGEEGSPITLTASNSTDPDGDPLQYRWDFNNDGTWDTDWLTNSMIEHTWNDDYAGNVTVEVWDGELTDTASAGVIINNLNPSINSITAPMQPNVVGTEISTSATFNDSGINDTHVAIWDWGDNTTSQGYINETDKTVSGNHVYSAAGVYTVALTITDDDGASVESSFHYVVIYDPSAGFVTAGGWINSPAGAYTDDTSLTGKSNYGFVCKYQGGASTPTGRVELQFKPADLNFRSVSFNWLVISGAKAMFTGTGTINGEGSYKFQITVIDADADSSDEFTVDRFRIKIWDDSSGNEVVIYDNALGNDSDSAITEIGGGSIVIH